MRAGSDYSASEEKQKCAAHRLDTPHILKISNAKC